MPVTTTWNSAPECGSSGAVTAPVSLGEARTKSVNIQIADQDNSIIIDQDQTFIAGECLKKGL